jgi:hypothetical protein
VAYGGGYPGEAPDTVIVCADRCVELSIVDSCPCHLGTQRQRVVNLSHEAWRQVTDEPLSTGLVEVVIYLPGYERYLEPPPAGAF